MKIHGCFRPRTDLPATMAAGGLGSYHHPYLGDAQTKGIDVIPKPWATPHALSLGVLTTQDE